jgi:hypothetical protein
VFGGGGGGGGGGVGTKYVSTWWKEVSLLGSSSDSTSDWFLLEG